MSIRQRGKKQVKTVRELREADPRRVSIVENGANQTPFRQVKSATGNEAVTDKETDMAKSKAKKSGAELVRVTFSKEQFKTEDAVKAWMTGKGYKESTITEEDKDYVVTSPEFDASKTAELKVIEAEAGVQYALLKADDTVSKAAEGEEEVVDDEPELDEEGDEDGDAEGEALKAAKKAEFDGLTKELTEKVNSMRVYYSDAEKMKDVLKEADDGMPIGIGELYGLFTKALENAASRGDEAGVKAVSAEFGTMFTDLMKVTNKFIAEATDKDAAATKTAEEIAAEATAKQVSDEAAKKAAEEEKTAILKGVEKSLEETVAKAIKSVQDSVDTAMKGLEEQLKTVSERVQGLENTEQTRKGADDAPESQTTKKGLSVLEKNMWGLR